MRKQIDKIEIKNPPIKEFSKKRSCLKRSCMAGCGCFAIAILISLIILKFTVAPRAKELRDLPSEFLELVPLYDRDSIQTITYTPGNERGNNLEKAAYIPKLVISPAVVWYNHNQKKPKDAGLLGYWDEFIAFMKEPVTDHRDIVIIEWSKIPAEYSFINQYYHEEFKKKMFTIGAESSGNAIQQFSFMKESIEGSLYIKDEPKTEETDYIRMTVTITLPPR